MGTNYYTKSKKCKACGYELDGIHLGKSSAGWQFSFQYNDGQYYKNVEEMKKWLKGKTIVDEYGVRIAHARFWDMVTRKQKEERLNHAQKYPSENNFVIGGYSFTNGYFS